MKRVILAATLISLVFTSCAKEDVYSETLLDNKSNTKRLC